MSSECVLVLQNRLATLAVARRARGLHLALDNDTACQQAHLTAHVHPPACQHLAEVRKLRTFW